MRRIVLRWYVVLGWKSIKLNNPKFLSFSLAQNVIIYCILVTALLNMEVRMKETN